MQPQDLPIVTTGHAARTLRRWGFRRVRRLPEWRGEEFVNDSEQLRITAVPAQHGPDVVHRLRRITERFPRLDAVLVHLGGTRVLGLVVTVDAARGAELLDLFRPEVAVPIHNDDHTVFHTSPDEISRAVARRELPVDLRTLEHGQTTHLVSDIEHS